MGRALVIFRALIVRRAADEDARHSRAEERAPDRLPPAPPAPAQSPWTPWTPPHGRDLLAGVALLAVLVAVLVVLRSGVPAPPRAGVAGPLARAGVDALPVAGAATSWDRVPLSGSPADLGGALGAAVEDGLAEARSRIDRCVAHERRRAGGWSPGAGEAPAELVLRLVARGRAFHVDDIEVRSAGSSPALVACARRLLDGGTFPADEVVPGRRYRLAVRLR